MSTFVRNKLKLSGHGILADGTHYSRELTSKLKVQGNTTREETVDMIQIARDENL